MAQKTMAKKKPDKYSSDAVKMLSTMEQFSAKQLDEVLRTLTAVNSYLDNKTYVGDVNFGKNHAVLVLELIKVRDQAKAALSGVKSAQLGPQVLQKYSQAYDLAQAAVGKVSKIVESPEESKAAFGNVVPAKLGEDTGAVKEHVTPNLPTMSITGGMNYESPYQVVLEALPASMGTELSGSPGAEGTQQYNVREDLQDMIEADMNGDHAGAVAAGQSLWDHLSEYNPAKRERMICGADAGSAQCSNLIDSLQAGDFDALFNGQNPVAVAFLEAVLDAGSSQIQTRVIVSGEADAKVRVLVGEEGYALYMKVKAQAVVTETDIEERAPNVQTGAVDVDNHTERDYSFGGDVTLGGEIPLGRRAKISAGTGFGITKPWWTREGMTYYIPAEFRLTVGAGPTEETGLLVDVSANAKIGVEDQERFVEMKEEIDLTLSLLQLNATLENREIAFQWLVYGSAAGLHLTADGLQQDLHNVPLMAGTGIQLELNEPGDILDTNGYLFLGGAYRYDALAETHGWQTDLKLGGKSAAGVFSFARDDQGRMNFSVGFEGTFSTGPKVEAEPKSKKKAGPVFPKAAPKKVDNIVIDEEE